MFVYCERTAGEKTEGEETEGVGIYGKRIVGIYQQRTGEGISIHIMSE